MPSLMSGGRVASFGSVRMAMTIPNLDRCSRNGCHLGEWSSICQAQDDRSCRSLAYLGSLAASSDARADDIDS